MALASRGNSGLNPNAPLFVPAAYKQIEDFSPEWWNLVQTSRWFHEYWIRERHIDDSDQQQPNDAEDFSELEFQLEQTLLQGLEESEDAYYQPEFGLSHDLDKDKLTTEQIPPQPKVLQSETQGGLKPEELCDNLKV